MAMCVELKKNGICPKCGADYSRVLDLPPATKKTKKGKT